MIDFCIECGHSIGKPPGPNGVVTCSHCGKSFRVAPPPQKKMIDPNEERIRQGVAARCALCQQVVEVRGSGAKTFVPHFRANERKVCPNSGKAVTS